MLEKGVKIILAALLLLCLAKMPYSYFQVVRFLSMLAFAWFAYLEVTRDRKVLMIVWIALAVLFQPMLKIALGRELWNVVDVIIAIGLVGSIFIPLPKKDDGPKGAQ